MQFYRITLIGLCLLLAVAGCTVAFDAEQEESFPCASDSECVDGFECADEGVCMKVQTGVAPTPECEDKDGDGYGVNDDRRKCQYAKFDCDDNDASVHPDNVELCDGVANSCDGEVDVFDCPSGAAALDCGTAPVGPNVMGFKCVDFKCVLVPTRQGLNECPEVAATCNSEAKAFTYESGGETIPLVEDENGNLVGELADLCG